MLRLALSALCLGLAGCNCQSEIILGGSDGGKNDGGRNDGGAGGGSGGGGGTDGGACGILQARVRDFKAGLPADFETATLGADRGIVAVQLGTDKKPVYAPVGTTPTTSGKASFDQWYRDTAGVNLPTTIQLPLSNPDAGLFVFDSSNFFPVDGLGFGNEGRPHNFHFTSEIHATFFYKGGERFTFRGDDDVFVFVNGRLAIDLGGVHGAESASIDFDARAAELGIVKNNSYPFDVFHAERHTTESNFRVETSIDCFVPVEIN